MKLNLKPSTYNDFTFASPGPGMSFDLKKLRQSSKTNQHHTKRLERHKKKQMT